MRREMLYASYNIIIAYVLCILAINLIGWRFMRDARYKPNVPRNPSIYLYKQCKQVSKSTNNLSLFKAAKEERFKLFIQRLVDCI